MDAENYNVEFLKFYNKNQFLKISTHESFIYLFILLFYYIFFYCDKKIQNFHFLIRKYASALKFTNDLICLNIVIHLIFFFFTRQEINKIVRENIFISF